MNTSNSAAKKQQTHAPSSNISPTSNDVKNSGGSFGRRNNARYRRLGWSIPTSPDNISNDNTTGALTNVHSHDRNYFGVNHSCIMLAALDDDHNDGYSREVVDSKGNDNNRNNLSNNGRARAREDDIFGMVRMNDSVNKPETVDHANTTTVSNAISTIGWKQRHQEKLLQRIAQEEKLKSLKMQQQTQPRQHQSLPAVFATSPSSSTVTESSSSNNTINKGQTPTTSWWNRAKPSSALITTATGAEEVIQQTLPSSRTENSSDRKLDYCTNRNSVFSSKSATSRTTVSSMNSYVELDKGSTNDAGSITTSPIDHINSTTSVENSSLFVPLSFDEEDNSEDVKHDNNSNAQSSRWKTLRDECSFFYNNSSPNDVRHQNNRATAFHPWRAIVGGDINTETTSATTNIYNNSFFSTFFGGPSTSTSDTTSTVGMSTFQYRPFDYNDAVTVVAPPVLQRYRTRYEELNQIVVCNSIDEDDDTEACGSDLYLDVSHTSQHRDDSTATSVANNKYSSNHALTTDTVELSTMFYYDKAYNNGRVFMKLPRDRVRLLQDPDLEPGVLSVEQRIDKSEAFTTTATTDRTSSSFSGNTQQQPILHELRYTVTIPDNIYQTIVSEMSYRYADSYGLYHCCSASTDDSDENKVDICVAIVILVLFLGICGFYTVWFHED